MGACRRAFRHAAWRAWKCAARDVHFARRHARAWLGQAVSRCRLSPLATDGVLPRLSAPAGTMFIRLNGIPEPPEGYVPPLGSSRETWTNIYKNKGRIDYCVQQFGVCSQRQETRGHTSNPDTSRMRNDTACGQHQHQHHPVNTLVCIMRARTNSLSRARSLSLSSYPKPRTESLPLPEGSGFSSSSATRVPHKTHATHDLAASTGKQRCTRALLNGAVLRR
jgi:hypothetical protein